MDCSSILSKIDCFGLCGVKNYTEEHEHEMEIIDNNNINNKTNKDLTKQKAKNNNDISFNVNAKKAEKKSNNISYINYEYNNNPNHINIDIKNNNNTSAEQTKINNNNNNTLADKTSNFINKSKQISKENKENKNSNNENKEIHPTSNNDNKQFDKMFKGSNAKYKNNNEQHSDINNKSLGEMLKEVNLPDNLTGNYRMPNVNNDNDNNDNEKLQKLINDINDQSDKKDKNEDKKSKNEDVNKKVEKKILKKLKPNGIKKNKYHGSNKLKLQSYTVNKKILSEPSQTPQEIQKTDMRLHNFLTKIVIKICELEKLFCEKNNGNCSKFWKNLVDDNDKTFKTKDNLFTRVLDRNYNHYNICNNNWVLQLLGNNNFMEIEGEPKTSEIVNQMVQQKSCEQLERLLRVSNADRQQFEKSRKDREHTFTGKVLTDPMVLKIDCSPINKSIEIMLMLSAIQDMALKIYNEESKEKEKQHAKNILLFFRQVLTTLYRKNIISVIDPKWKQGTAPTKEEAERRKYWKELLLLNENKQIKKENDLINFNLNNDTTEIYKIELEKLFWKNGKQFDGKNFHYVFKEMTDLRRCIDERPDFALNNSIMLDKIKK